MTDNVKYYLEDLEVGMKSTTMSVITVTAVAEVAEINERTGRVKMKCHCEVNGQKICRGDAGVFVGKRPEV